MSGAQTSTFPDQNKLLEANAQQLANYYAPERNRLFVQEAQQKIAGNEMEVMSRIASGLMSLPEDQRANAYPGAVQYAQSLGFGKNAPPVYPGHEATQRLASMGIPAVYQYKLAADRSAKQALFPDAPGAGTGAATAPAVPGGAYGQGGGNTAAPPAELMPYFQEASARTGIPVDVLIAQARQESSFNANAVGGAGEIGIGQILPSTARSPGYGLPPVDPAALKDPRTNINFQADYLKALLPPGADPKDPAAIRAALLRYNGGGDPNYVNNVTRYLPTPGGTTTAAAPAPSGGVPARIPGAVNVAGPGAGGTTAEQPGNQGLMNRLSVFGGAGSPAEPPVAPVVAAPAVPAAPAVAAPAATPSVPDLPVPQAPNIQANGFTPQQTAWLRTLRDNPSVSADELRKAQDTLRTQNTAAVEKYQADVKAYRADVLAQQKAAREAAGEQDPIQGKDEKANADRTLFKYVDKVLEGTATTEERRLYAQAAQYYLKPQMQWISDPNDPTKQQMVPVPGQLPAGFPPPTFKPGEQQPAPPTTTVTKSDLKPLPETERKVLIETATKLDQITEQRDTFKPDYAGYLTASAGDTANLIARSNPFASKGDIERAEWWQNYQRMKLAVRQGVSGQSLTASELAEFDKADINPGMKPEVIRANLAHQDQVLRTAHERRVGSLLADRFSPESVQAASGVDPAKLTPRPLGPTSTTAPPARVIKYDAAGNRISE